MIFMLGAAVGSIVTMGVIVLWSLMSMNSKFSRVEEQQEKDEAEAYPYGTEIAASEVDVEESYIGMADLPTREPIKKRSPSHTAYTPKHRKN